MTQIVCIMQDPEFKNLVEVLGSERLALYHYLKSKKVTTEDLFATAEQWRGGEPKFSDNTQKEIRAEYIAWMTNFSWTLLQVLSQLGFTTKIVPIFKEMIKLDLVQKNKFKSDFFRNGYLDQHAKDEIFDVYVAWATAPKKKVEPAHAANV